MPQVVIRRLPPSLTKEQLEEHLQPLPEHDYFEFFANDSRYGRLPRSGRCREPPLPPAGPPRQPSALGLCLCSLYPHMFSRAYINFKNQEDIVLFRDRFDGYVFVDHKGKWTALGGCCCFPRCLVGFGRGGCGLFGFSASYNSSSSSRNTYIYRYIVTITF